MEIPKNLTFVEGFYFTDGGSIVLRADAADGVRHQITLGQHRFLDYYDPNVLPGRLYFDHLLVPIRSEMETQVIARLKDGEIVPENPPETATPPASSEGGPVVIVGDDLKEYYAKVSEGKRETIQHLIQNVIDFVGSRDYIRIAKQIEKKDRGDTGSVL